MREIDSIVEELLDDGIVVNWSPEGAFADPCSLTGVERATVLYQLAVRLCPHFGREPAQSIIMLASSAYSRLQRIQMVQSMAPVTLAVPAAEGGSYGYDITKG